MSHYYATTTTLDTLMVGVKFDTATTSLAGLAIDEAQDEINKYVNKRYDVSTFVTSTAFSTNPPTLKTLAQQLAAGKTWIYLARGGSKESVARGTFWIKRVEKCLIDIINNKADILNADGSELTERSPAQQVLSNTDTRSSTFDEDDPLRWTVDSDKLDDITSDRS